jgi:hypothetical protein
MFFLESSTFPRLLLGFSIFSSPLKIEKPMDNSFITLSMSKSSIFFTVFSFNSSQVHVKSQVFSPYCIFSYTYFFREYIIGVVKTLRTCMRLMHSLYYGES